MSCFFSPLALCWSLLLLLFLGNTFANLKCQNPMTNEAYKVPDNNVLVKLFQDGKLSIGEEMKQFVCDLSKQSMAIESVGTDTSAQLTECQQPMAAQLMPNLHSAIVKLTTAINGGVVVANSELEAVKNLLQHSLFLLADWRQIPRDELVPSEERTNANEQPQNALKELAKIWNENKHQNWQNDKKTHNNYNSENGQNEKRMLQLMLDLSNFGSSELADNRKSVKKSQRRRKKRNLNTEEAIAIFAVVCLIVIVVIFAAACKSRGTNATAASSGGAAKRSSWIGIRNVPMSSGRASGHNIPPSYNVPAQPPPSREEGCNIQ
ncbi:hypothetical protein niasHS_006285 [Heterodera schachtii]|uniref:Uncharacterized protein n=1 Tax=Heterodera schachtii TaxID=97005 RepID=A0ABD2JT00_HETSC